MWYVLTWLYHLASAVRLDKNMVKVSVALSVPLYLQLFKKQADVALNLIRLPFCCCCVLSKLPLMPEACPADQMHASFQSAFKKRPFKVWLELDGQV
jgi:hypothetical protein